MERLHALAPLTLLLAACNLDAVPGGDCSRLPEGRNQEDCVYALARSVRTDSSRLEQVLQPLDPPTRDSLRKRLAADDPSVAATVCAGVKDPAERERCGGGSVLPER